MERKASWRNAKTASLHVHIIQHYNYEVSTEKKPHHDITTAMYSVFRL